MMLYSRAMAKHEINIYIKPNLRDSVKETWVKNTVNKILGTLTIATLSELGVVITNDKAIQRLNKAYRNKDAPTDVLAFYMLPRQAKKTEFIAPPDGVAHFGEIVISYPQAVVQAENEGHDIKHEILVLLIHGLLHLMGYNHEQSRKEEQRMRAKEKETLDKLMSI